MPQKPKNFCFCLLTLFVPNHTIENIQYDEKGDMNIILGNINSKMGSGIDGRTHGGYELQIRNERTNRLSNGDYNWKYIVQTSLPKRYWFKRK